MDNGTVDRAYEIICDRPGITRGQLTVALATPGHEGSDRTTDRVISHLRYKQHKITNEGHGYRAIAPSRQHGDLKDLTFVQDSATRGSKGLTSFGAPSRHRANSNTKHIDSAKTAGMGGEEKQASPDHDPAGMDNTNVEVDALARSTITGMGEPEHLDTGDNCHKDLDTEGSDMNADVAHPIPSQLVDVIEEVRALLALSVRQIKAQNQANGCLVGLGRKKSMTREPWEHLQYAADLLARPGADVDDLLVGIECLRDTNPDYVARPIPWDVIHAEYPRLPSRPFVAIMHPGPPEEDIEALAEEYGYTRAVPGEPIPAEAIEPEEYEWPDEPILPAPVATVNHRVYEPTVHEDMASMRARHAQAQQADSDARYFAATAKMAAEIAQEAAVAIEAPATPAPAPAAVAEPVRMYRRPGEDQECFEWALKLDREMAELLAARAA